MGNCENKLQHLREGQFETYSFMNTDKDSETPSTKNKQSGIEGDLTDPNKAQIREEITFGDTNYQLQLQTPQNGIIGRKEINSASRRSNDFRAPQRVQNGIKGSARNSRRPSLSGSSARGSRNGSRRPSREFEQEDLKLGPKQSKYKQQQQQQKQGSSHIKEFSEPDQQMVTNMFQQAQYQEILKKYPELDGIVDPLAITQKEDNFVIYEGKLLKYKPGTAFNWVERWCVLTKSEFMYYKNQWNSYCYDMRPLVSIPINDVLAVFKVNLDLPNMNGNKKKNLGLTSDQKTYKELFQFEIFNDMSDYPYYQEVFAKYDDEDVYETESSRQAEKTKQEFDVENLDGFKLWNQYEQDRRNRQSPSRVSKGHLMRMPQNVNKHYRSRDTHMRSFDSGSPYTSHYERSSKGATQSIDGMLSHTSGSGSKNKTPKKQSGSPLKGAVYKWVKNNQDLTSWTNREKEWYFSEKRLLFAAPSAQERDRWVKLLQFVNNEIHDQQQ